MSETGRRPRRLRLCAAETVNRGPECPGFSSTSSGQRFKTNRTLILENKLRVAAVQPALVTEPPVTSTGTTSTANTRTSSTLARPSLVV